MSKHSLPERWLDEHGKALYGYAYLRLQDTAVAEDVVQETLLAAWRSRAQFAGKSSERTWLISILKRRLVDYWRKQGRERRHVEAVSVHEGADDLDDVFDRAGRWRTELAPWPEPDAALERQEFWQVLTDCLAALPPAQARAFCLCELDGLSTDEACRILNVAPNNLWVLLHRARLRLREGMQRHWFDDHPAAATKPRPHPSGQPV